MSNLPSRNYRRAGGTTKFNRVATKHPKSFVRAQESLDIQNGFPSEGSSGTVDAGSGIRYLSLGKFCGFLTRHALETFKMLLTVQEVSRFSAPI